MTDKKIDSTSEVRTDEAKKFVEKAKEAMAGSEPEVTPAQPESQPTPEPTPPPEGQPQPQATPEPAPAQPDLRPLEKEAKVLIAALDKTPEQRNRLGAIFLEIRRVKRAQGVAGAGWRKYVEETFGKSYKTAERMANAYDAGLDCRYIPLNDPGTLLEQQIAQLQGEIEAKAEILAEMGKEPQETPEEAAALELEKSEKEKQKALLAAQLQAQKDQKDAELLAKTPEIGAKFWTVADFQIKEVSVVERGPGCVRFEAGGLMAHLDKKGNFDGYFAEELDAASSRFDLIGSSSKKLRDEIGKLKAELEKAEADQAKLEALKRKLLSAPTAA